MVLSYYYKFLIKYIYRMVLQRVFRGQENEKLYEWLYNLAQKSQKPGPKRRDLYGALFSKWTTFLHHLSDFGNTLHFVLLVGSRILESRKTCLNMYRFDKNLGFCYPSSWIARYLDTQGRCLFSALQDPKNTQKTKYRVLPIILYVILLLGSAVKCHV